MNQRYFFPDPACAQDGKNDEPRSRWRWIRERAWAFFLCTGCGLDSNFADLGETLLSPDIQGFNLPGQQVLSGPHSALRTLQDADGSAYAAGIEPEGGLSLYSFRSGEDCRHPDIFAYTTPLERNGEASLIPALSRAENDSSDLVFLDFQCAIHAKVPNIQQFPFAQFEPAAGEANEVLLRRGSTLLRLDPWQDESQVVAEQVTGRITRPLGLFHWQEAGRLTLRDEHLEPLGEVGTNVLDSDLSTTLGELAYTERSGESAEAGPLYVASVLNASEPEQIESEACSPRYLRTGNVVQLAYFSPCEDRRLVLYDGADKSRRVVASEVIGYAAIPSREDPNAVSFLTSPVEEALLGDLWLGPGDSEPVLLGSDSPGPARLRLPSGELLALVNWNQEGQRGRGELIVWDNDTATTLAEDVTDLNALGQLDNGNLTVLANFNGVVGDVLELNSQGVLGTLATEVPFAARQGDSYLADFVDRRGTLYQLNRASGDSEVIAQEVPLGGFAETQQWPGWLVLSEGTAEEGRNRLHLHLTDPPRQFLVQSNVTQVSEVSIPSEGVLYGVGEGPNTGAWFAKAR